ncbi:MAG TPA: FtsX-like permease family protein [Nocardioides sp.]|nr:FtsX-like permease family protein [Nocardioides sp.]
MEALVGVSARPGRLLLTTVGEALGLAALVATVSLTTTAGAQVSKNFDAAAARQVTVQVAPDRAQLGATLPRHAEQRVTDLQGVDAAGTLTRLALQRPSHTAPVTDPHGLPNPVLPIFAASVGLFDAVDAKVTGRTFDAGHAARGDRVALLGVDAAERLGIHDLSFGPAVFVGDQALTVVGIVDDVSRNGELLDGIIVPEKTAAGLFGWRGAASLVVEVAPNAADVIARQAPLAIAPGDPASLEATAPPTDTTLRSSVQKDVSALLLVLGIVTLAAGGFGIANSMLLSVMERVGEIGLRRCLGATRSDLMTQFLVESAAIGLLGGIVGTSLGLVTSMAVALTRDWTPVVTPELLAAPLAGLVLGALAGAFPAWRAGSLEPAEAMRGL